LKQKINNPPFLFKNVKTKMNKQTKQKKRTFSKVSCKLFLALLVASTCHQNENKKKAMRNDGKNIFMMT